MLNVSVGRLSFQSSSLGISDIEFNIVFYLPSSMGNVLKELHLKN